MKMDRPMIQDHIDALSLRIGGVQILVESYQRRPAHRRRPPGDHLAGHDVPTAHAAQVAIGRPTPFRPHRIGADRDGSARMKVCREDPAPAGFALDSRGLQPDGQRSIADL